MSGKKSICLLLAALLTIGTLMVTGCGNTGEPEVSNGSALDSDSIF